MDSQVLQFLQNNHVSVLATQLIDGSPYTAVLHYSHTESPFEIYFSTDSESKKMQMLKTSGKCKAALTIGLSETEWITLQMTGELFLISDASEIQKAKEVHYAKNPGSKKFEGESTTIFLRFVPASWRYTDFNTTPVTYIENK